MRQSEKESEIPVGTQFSPELIDLSAYAKMVVAFSGNIDKLREMVIQPPVRIKPYSCSPTNRMKGLPLEAGVQYGLLSEGKYEATDLAKRLATLNEPEVYVEFARHILLNLKGLRVLEAIEEMILDGYNITGDSLAQYLTDQGFRVTVHNTAINTMRMWLAQAGLFSKGKGNTWMPNKSIKEKLLRMNDSMIASLASFSVEQIAFAKALCLLEPADWISAAEVRDLAETTYGVRFGRSALPKEILSPLKEGGLIEFEAKGTRSGKTSRLKLTSMFQTDVLKPFMENTIKDLNGALTAYYRRRPEDIYGALDSKNKYIKGHALEAFTIYIMRLLGLRFLGWRRRAQESGYSEVDVLLAGLFGGVPTTWQVQCKNTPANPVRLEDIAKEVGLLPLTHSSHILIVANSTFTEDARKFAREIMINSSVTIFLLDSQDFDLIRKVPSNISHILKSQAEHIRDLKIKAPLWGGIEKPR